MSEFNPEADQFAGGQNSAAKILLARAFHPTRIPVVAYPARLLALLLAALWLPLTMHCQLARLDIASVLSDCCDDHSCAGGDCDCQSDVCKLIEAGHYDLKRTSTSLPVMAVDWLGSLEFLTWRPSLAKPVAVRAESTGSPPEWGRVWHFVFRAAPAPRAPSAVC